MFTLTLLAGLGAQEKTNCTSMCADDPRLLKICRHVSTVQYSITVHYSTVQQYSIVFADMSDISVEAKPCFV